uniref:AlNc14C104G6165 protein n=1 Tax=Albugo laibachii Nc14 TaxID=890382 RepID=F0WHV8_9STRA|nr:AlNc14C104G6165 [Albugo laibachii Nc14]|eukprot:CCA20833.1 AlNc14C104G6165 [Albugo laibachii Nc14]
MMNSGVNLYSAQIDKIHPRTASRDDYYGRITETETGETVSKCAIHEYIELLTLQLSLNKTALNTC